MTLQLRFIDGVDSRLKTEIVPFGKWLRRWYKFPVKLEVRLIHKPVLVDADGAECFLRWWQNGDNMPVKAEIAVGSFAKNFDKEGPEVAYPTVVAAVARALQYYFQVIRDSPLQEDYVEEWGDLVLEAYVQETSPPPPWEGAWPTEETQPV